MERGGRPRRPHLVSRHYCRLNPRRTREPREHARDEGNEKGASFRDDEVGIEYEKGNETCGNLQLDRIIAGGKMDLSIDPLIERGRETPLSTKQRQKAAMPACLRARVLRRRTMSMAAANSVNRKEATLSAAAAKRGESVFIRKLPALKRATSSY